MIANKPNEILNVREIFIKHDYKYEEENIQ